MLDMEEEHENIYKMNESAHIMNFTRVFRPFEFNQ